MRRLYAVTMLLLSLLLCGGEGSAASIQISNDDFDTRYVGYNQCGAYYGAEYSGPMGHCLGSNAVTEAFWSTSPRLPGCSAKSERTCVNSAGTTSVVRLSCTGVNYCVSHDGFVECDGVIQERSCPAGFF